MNIARLRYHGFLVWRESRADVQFKYCIRMLQEKRKLKGLVELIWLRKLRGGQDAWHTYYTLGFCYCCHIYESIVRIKWKESVRVKEVIPNTLVTTSIAISEMEEGGGDRALENLVSAVQGHLRVESLAATGATKNRLLHFWKPVKPGLDTSEIFFSFSLLVLQTTSREGNSISR